MVRPAASMVMAFAALIVWASGAAATPAQLPGSASGGSTRLLDVPYFPQSEDLCGGAAIAMVLRYWGDRQVHPEDFSPLIDRGASGIPTDVLTTAVLGRGWHAMPQAGAGGDGIRAQIDRGRPVVALIEVGPSRYHYVVIVGWTADHVIVHDPAIAPFRVMSKADFDRAWTAARRWALLVLPGDNRPGPIEPAPAPAETPAPVADACAPLVLAMVGLARDGQLAAAELGLLAATQTCPLNASAWRELAGIRFLQSAWADAAQLAERAAALEPADAAGWDLLATSRFLNDEPNAALGAWNRIGRPAIDLVRVEGVRRTRHPIVIGLLDLSPGEPLTTASLGRAARRLDELPSAAATRLRYRPTAGGLADIEAIVVERPTVPRGAVPIAAMAARAWLQREVRVDAASPTASGELLTVAFRWWEARPRIAMALAVPAVSWWPGVTTIEGSWERQSYAATPVSALDRRRAGMRVADWASSALRWTAGLAFDRWAEDSHLAADAGLDLRLAGDRVAVGLDAAAWAPFGSGQRFASSQVASAWRSTIRRDQPAWSISAAFAAASGGAPLDVWPGAGTGHGRAPLLRAHPLLDAGVINGEVFGRRLVHGSIEYRRPVLTTAAGSLHVAVFADAARAWQRATANAGSIFHADLGTGLRVALPGRGGTLRVDVARGLRDRQAAISAGWQPPWPGRNQD